MKPSHCAACGNYHREAVLLRFAKGPEDLAWDARAASGMVTLGAPPYAAWFCPAHLAAAQELVDQPLSHALASLERQVRAEAARHSLRLWSEVEEYGGELPAELEIGDQRWRLLAAVDVGDAASERAVDFWIGDSEELQRVQRAGAYPDGQQLEDRGRRQVGGFCELRVSGAAPGQMVAFLWRTWLGYGEHRARVELDEQPVGSVLCASPDPSSHPWRTQGVWIDGAQVTAPEFTLRRVLDEGSEAEVYRLWVYQAGA